MRKNLFILFFSITSAAIAQKEVSIGQQSFDIIPLNSSYKRLDGTDPKEPLFYTKNVDFTNGNISFYIRQQYPGMLGASKTGGIAISNGYTLIPALGVVSFDNNLVAKPTILEYINLYDTWNKPQPYEYTVMGPKMADMGKQSTHKRLADLKQLYPNAFAPFNFTPIVKNYRGVEYGLGPRYFPYTSSSVVKGFSLPEMTPVFDAGVKNQVTIDFKNNPVKLMIQAKEIYNPNTKTWTVLAGENLEGKENKWSEYRNYHFITTDESGKVLKDETHTFDFIRTAWLNQYATDINNPSNGRAVYIFGSQMVLFGGGKLNDPDKTKYQIIVLNNDGSIAYKHDFNFGTNNSFTPVFSYIKNEKVYVVGNSNGLVLFEADATGIKPVSQDVTEVFGSINAKLGKDGTFQLKDYKIVGDKLFVWGEHKKQVQMATTTQDGKSIPEINHYINFVVIQVDLANNKVVGQYTFDRTEGNLKEETPIEDIIVSGNKLVFVTVINKRSRDLNDMTKLNFYSNDQYAKSGLNFLDVTKPYLYTVDFEAKKSSTYKVSDPLYASLYPRGSYFKEGNNLYFFGFKDDGSKDAITYQVVKVSIE